MTAKVKIDMDARVQVQVKAPGSRLQIWLMRGILVLILLMAGLIGVRAVKEPAKIEGVVIYARQARGHDDSLTFPTSDLPPVGGVHHSQIQNCGIYLSPVDPGNSIHSMEHGAIWITYQPGMPEEDIAFLQEKVRNQEYLLLSPYIGQRSLVVLTAWGVQLEINSVHDWRLDKFIARYRLGPNTPERGASCAGGFGNPLP